MHGGFGVIKRLPRPRSWGRLRTDKTGFHFRRPCPRAGFYPDFVWLRARVVVEVDGGIHEARVEYDALRTAIFNARGYTVVRLTNEEVLADTHQCVQRIAALCRDRVAHRDRTRGA